MAYNNNDTLSDAFNSQLFLAIQRYREFKLPATDQNVRLPKNPGIRLSIRYKGAAWATFIPPSRLGVKSNFVPSYCAK